MFVVSRVVFCYQLKAFRYNVKNLTKYQHRPSMHHNHSHREIHHYSWASTTMTRRRNTCYSNYRGHSGHTTYTYLSLFASSYTFATTTIPENQKVFNRHTHWLHKKGAALLSNSSDYDYFRQEIAGRMVSRVLDLDRDHKNALEVGSNSGQFYKEMVNYIKGNPGQKSPGGIEMLTQIDACKEMLMRDEIPEHEQALLRTVRQQHITTDAAVDAATDANPYECETLSAFEDNSFDIVISCMSIQWINNIPRLFSEILRVLRPDGAFVGAFIGGGTLQELRSALLLADQERRGGYGTHISPMVNISDVGNLLSRSGFNLVTIDNEVIEIPYPDMFTGVTHLQCMGDNFCGVSAQNIEAINFKEMSDVLIAAAAIYDQMYTESDRITVELREELLHETKISQQQQQQRVMEDGANDGKKTHDAGNVNVNVNEDEDEDEIDENEEVLLDLSVDASLQVIYFMGWKPDISQGKPLERGSQDASFRDLEEIASILDEEGPEADGMDDNTTK